MTADFGELKALAEQELNLTLSETLALKRRQYTDIIPEEIFELLEEAVETYATLAPSLPPALQDIALQEIEFFISLYQDKSRDSPSIRNIPSIQKILTGLKR